MAPSLFHTLCHLHYELLSGFTDLFMLLHTLCMCVCVRMNISVMFYSRALFLNAQICPAAMCNEAQGKLSCESDNTFLVSFVLLNYTYNYFIIILHFLRNSHSHALQFSIAHVYFCVLASTAKYAAMYINR